METVLDVEAFFRKSRSWIRGLQGRGFKGAHEAAAGLA